MLVFFTVFRLVYDFCKRPFPDIAVTIGGHAIDLRCDNICFGSANAREDHVCQGGLSNAAFAVDDYVEALRADRVDDLSDLLISAAEQRCGSDGRVRAEGIDQSGLCGGFVAQRNF